MRVHSIRVKNFKSLRDVSMKNIPGFAVLVGANGTGKSTFIGIFDFLKDCLKNDVRAALQKRGGFSQVVSRGHEGEAIQIELQIQMDIDAIKRKRLVTYRLEIVEQGRRILIAEESLRFKRGRHGYPYYFIRFKNGVGEALAESFDAFDKDVPLDQLEREEAELDAPHILALKGLGQFRHFDAASQLRKLIENWIVSDFRIEDARIEPDAAVAEHLNERGSNIALYAQYLLEDHRETYETIVSEMARLVPGIAEVITADTGDGRVALRFRDKAFEKDFIARAVSDGTIKMFAYLALLHDPAPHPLLCVEEPENQLYPTLLEKLSEQFAEYAKRRKGEGQVFVTTHSPDFLNEVPLDAIYWLQKRNGFTKIHRGGDNLQLQDFIAEGDKPGWLWRQRLFEGVDP